jgi:hypothetical protein
LSPLGDGNGQITPQIVLVLAAAAHSILGGERRPLWQIIVPRIRTQVNLLGV